MAAGRPERVLDNPRPTCYTRTVTFPRFTCPACGREVASVYALGAVHSTREQHYAYLRRHRTPAGAPCPNDTVRLATVLRP